MLLVMLGGFVVASVIIEMMIVRQIPALARLAGKYKLVGISLSVGLSWLLGHLFAAGGAVVLIGSIASSVLTQPMHWYRVNRQRCIDVVVRLWQDALDYVRTLLSPARKIHLQVGRYRASAWVRMSKGRIYTSWSWKQQQGRRM